jgi:hypothetical protein
VIAANLAINEAIDLGFLGEAPLVFSGTDFSPVAAQMPAVLDYHRGLVDVFTPHGWVGGAYGPRTVLTQLSTADFWPAGWPLWHWGGDGRTIYPWAWAKQWYGKSNANPPHDNTPIGITVDENTLLKPMLFWSGYGPDLPPDPPESGVHPMATFLGYVKINETGAYGGLVIGTDNVLYARDQHGEGVGVFAFPTGACSQQSYDALPKYDPVADAAWLGAHLGITSGGVGPAPKGVNIQTVPGLATVTY